METLVYFSYPCGYAKSLMSVLYQVQDLLLEYGVENVAETLIEGLSRVKRCTDEGRALMSLDLQVPFYFPLP